MDSDTSIGARPTLSSNDVAIMRLKESIDELTTEVRELREIVLGNGNPSNSLMSKVDCLIGAWDNFEEWQARQDSATFRGWLWHAGNSAANFVSIVWLVALTWLVAIR